MEMVLAVLGIAGTLGGTFLGGWLQAKQQREQRTFDDRTRFHAARLDTYATFLGTLRRFVVLVYRWRARFAAALGEKERAQIEEIQADMWVAVERLALLASPDVIQQSEEMYSDVNLLVHQVSEQSDKERLDALNTFFNQFLRKRDRLRDTMRSDMSVGEKVARDSASR